MCVYLSLSTNLQVLSKALMQLPATDFSSCMHLIPHKLHSMDPVKTLFKWYTLAESCQFKKFWHEVESNKHVCSKISGFEDTMRSFIASVCEVTFANMPLQLAKEYLHCTDSKEQFEDFMSEQGWTRSDDGKAVVLPVQDSNQPPQDRKMKLFSIEQMAKVMSNLTIV
jgi:translation initiation factor 3 subunit K